ncbi:MAG: NADH-quinone oxidoreductase subunit H [Pseudomonadota bacterium]
MDAFATSVGTALLTVIQCTLVVAILLVTAIFLAYMDRKVWAAAQLRRGHHGARPGSEQQTLREMLTLALRETTTPADAKIPIMFAAPLLTFTLALIGWAAIPFAESWVLSDLNIGVLYLFAMSSLGVYSVMFSGSASGSEYSVPRSLRSAALMFSFQVSMGLAMASLLLSTGSLNLMSIVAAQDGRYGIASWYWLPHLPVLAVFFISALAATNRPPFDLPAAESELVSGYRAGYSPGSDLVRMVGEYLNIALICAVGTVLFFGGWLSPIPTAIDPFGDGVFWFLIKALAFFFVFAVTKAVVPRYRYDQLMWFAWKVCVPISLGWVLISACLAKFEVAGYSRYAIGG